MPKTINSPFSLAFALALSETFISANAQYYYPRRRRTTGGVIAGIVVAAIAGILLFMLLCMMTRRRRRGLAVMPFGRPGRQQNTPLPTTMNHNQAPYPPQGPYPPPGAPGVGSNHQQYQPPHGAPGAPDKEVAPQYTEFAPPPGPPPTAPAAAHTTGKDESFIGGFRHS